MGRVYFSHTTAFVERPRSDTRWQRRTTEGERKVTMENQNTEPEARCSASPCSVNEFTELYGYALKSGDDRQSIYEFALRVIQTVTKERDELAKFNDSLDGVMKLGELMEENGKLRAALIAPSRRHCNGGA